MKRKKNAFIYFTYEDEKKIGDVEYKRDESPKKVSTEYCNMLLLERDIKKILNTRKTKVQKR